MDWYKNKKETLDYEFEALDNINYKCTLLIPKVSNRMFITMFQKAKQKTASKAKRRIGGNPDLIEAFDVDQHFLKLVNTVIGKQMREIVKEVGKDGIKIITNRVDKARFIRDKDSKDWKVKIIVLGDYLDNR